MTRLSVNVNKIATLRNARGGNVPDVLRVALDCERFGAQGITVHPRPDERHIRRSDVYDLKKALTTEFNIEGNPDERFIRLIEEIRSEQVIMVPDAPDVLRSFLRGCFQSLHKKSRGICKQGKAFVSRAGCLRKRFKGSSAC